MNASISQPTPVLNIASVERDTGLSKDTLRVWERRYGFPSPARDSLGERWYNAMEVEKLRLVKQLVALGHRPGKIIHRSSLELRELAQVKPASSPEIPEDLTKYLSLLRSHRTEEFSRALSETLMRAGLAEFVFQTVAPLTAEVGRAWACGTLEIFEEHLFAESIQGVLRSAIQSTPEIESRPRVLLTTFPQEPHGLGLLMAEAILSLEGCVCVSLGPQTPLLEIVRAAASQPFDIVALSFSTLVNSRQVIDGLTELRRHLASSVELWVGGSHPILKHATVKPLCTVLQLQDLRAALAHWRAQTDGQATAATSA
jgi:DNA-binding transcriptional MerR regulator/methylmalonyl-CoA mutase cobalamin-binding subunit